MMEESNLADSTREPAVGASRLTTPDEVPSWTAGWTDSRLRRVSAL